MTATPREPGSEPLRIGVLGAARIARLSIVSPSRATGARLVAVAARDSRRAQSFAAEHGIERVLGSYAELVADPQVEVVYNPLVNGLHGAWNRQSAAAGKHVLAEKPSAANTAEARKTLAAVQGSGRLFMEAFHFPYHPLFQRVCTLIADGAVGNLQHVECVLYMPDPGASDPRWQLDLAGGATMDLGCYSIACLRLLGAYAGGSPQVRTAHATERRGHPGVDERLLFEAEYPSGVTASGGSDMAHDTWDFHLTVAGSAGRIHVPDFARPHEDDTLVLLRPGRDSVEEHLGRRSSYTYQLETFTHAVRDGCDVLTDAAWAVRNMELVDDAYRAAGLPVREPG